jgi:hypothetical protein
VDGGTASQHEGQLEQGIIFFYTEMESKIINWEQHFFVHYRTASPVNRVVC